MNESKKLPIITNKNLLLSTVGAIIISAAIYLVLILPAEYNIDPTGIGEKLGLNVLSETKPQNINEQVDTEKTLTENLPDFRQDKAIITIPAKKGIEYKFHLKQYGHLTYEWITKGSENILFDFHGEPAGDTTGYFESYGLATTHEMKGSATMPFAGSHGWYWRNDSDQEIKIELKTSGSYQIIGLK